MGQRNSQEAQDAVTWTTAALPLGARGLDLRQTAEPGALSKLTNARFVDERTLARRDGHTGVIVQDAADFPPVGNSLTASSWIYGHGQYIDQLSLLTESHPYHYPIAGKGCGIFGFGDSEVAWTGDRLLVIRRDGFPCVGESAHWNRVASTPLKYGLPAYLPTMVDGHPPETLTGDYIETALTRTLRVVIASDENDKLLAWVIDRTTGAVLNRTTIYSGTAIRDPRVVNSDDIPVIVFRDDATLKITHWNGIEWTTPSVISADVDMHDLFAVTGGFYLLWRTPAGDTGDLKVGKYVGIETTDSPLTFGTVVTPATSDNTVGAAALAVAPNGMLAVVWQLASSPTLHLSLYNAAGGDENTIALGAVGPWDSGVTACFRLLPDSYQVPDSDTIITSYPAVIHAANGALYTKIWEVFGVPGSADAPHIRRSETRYNTKLMSKSFRVGDEVFCWLRATNSNTGYLVGGVKMPQVSGVCDREEAHARVVNDGILGISRVAVDPLDEYAHTWCRPYVTQVLTKIDNTVSRWAQTYARPGNARIGDLQFLPALSTAQYGQGVYLSGSHVRVYDGVELGDAGFHDYPTIEGTPSQSNSTGALTLLGTYYFRVYPVRYTRRGERFQGPAVTSSAVVLTTDHDTIQLTINTVPVTNHEDIVFEVYRTEAGGTTFYLDGVVANSLGASTVTYTSTVADSTLITRQADPHATGVGNVSEIEELGPTGCEILAVGGDRLWCAGGQIPSGWVEFSKLKKQLEGAGFDALAGYQEIDCEGGAITSIVGLGDGVVVFERHRLYVLGGGGPDNYGSGGFSTPQLVLADGATTHLGTGVTQAGVLFWGSDGPRLLDLSLRVQDIHLPIRTLSETLTPTGLRLDLSRQEAVWYTADGTALLWNYQSGTRWAKWTGLHVAGVCCAALITTDGVVMYEDSDAAGDMGNPYAFTGATTDMNPDQILGGAALIRDVGIVGLHNGPHNLRFRVYFNGAPLWTDQWTWEPAELTYLSTGVDWEDLTPAQIDALGVRDHSGGYATHKRTSRQSCRTFRVEWSDVSADGPTYTPYELTLEVGVRGGLGRVSVNTFTK